MGNPIAPTTELHLGTVTANCGIPARLDGTKGMRSKLSVSTVAGLSTHKSTRGDQTPAV